MPPAAGPNAGFGIVIDGRAFALADSVRSLGPALHWAAVRDCESLTLLADVAVAGDLARRAALVSPQVEVWAYHLADGKPMVELATPTQLADPPELPDSHRALSPLIAAAGALPVEDYGRLVAEVLGLEVARVVDGDEPAVAKLDVGVGLADRELQSYIHGGLTDAENLARVVDAVSEHRCPGAAVHPLARIGRQRWLRAMLIEDPSLVGAQDLVAMVPLRASDTVLSEAPAAAASSDGSIVVVCQVGADLDLVPEALEYQSQRPGSRLMIVVPERDRAVLDARLRFMVGPAANDSVAILGPPVPWG